ncbi:hypothetical protein J2W97_003356 [Paenibacillus jamilae]|jgi:hypothetical protein|uniref:Uncharacterized protein n=1 Tax=Paenibacillus polymyxa TaxID=1406 RepID=A0A0F0G4D1_PAEPO|nr:hypothetical protein PPSQR21_047010 [Paenibacillus polymyxa SQR-21]AIY09012.1 hypothetical protein LK13_10725 [Paenibacillus polymyxa]KKD54620.1 hypothetical protein C400_11635 [Paenibacillus sp. ICGEB2008]MDP9677346.1 hypothetical protein [Paenibacillus jamilae]UOD86278.1 hypothetical protein CUU60_14120 [Paenibacillus polymyxa ATCC 842]
MPVLFLFPVHLFRQNVNNHFCFANLKGTKYLAIKQEIGLYFWKRQLKKGSITVIEGSKGVTYLLQAFLGRSYEVVSLSFHPYTMPNPFKIPLKIQY